MSVILQEWICHVEFWELESGGSVLTNGGTVGVVVAHAGDVGRLRFIYIIPEPVLYLYIFQFRKARCLAGNMTVHVEVDNVD